MPVKKVVKPVYTLSCDDPYKVLAYRIVVNYPPPIVKRILTEPKFLRREVVREVRGQDFRGIFLDCLMVALPELGLRTDFNRQLTVLGKYLYSKLDLNRMRREIADAYTSLGVKKELL